jgi:Rod binding domain-containing protein
MISTPPISDAMIAAPITVPQDATGFDKALDREKVRQSAAQLVSSAFILPVLESMHDSPFLQGPFAPGFAEKRFMPLLDQHIADRITSGANFPLVDVITERLMGAES